jgi:hypothetical protein
MLVDLVEVDAAGDHLAGATDLQVGGDMGESLRVAAGEEQAGAASGVVAGDRFGDGGGGAED